jgi:hypothetical protein
VECLEVAVNGERYCIAARYASPRLSASSVQFVDRQGLDHATGYLLVHGSSAYFKTHFEWGGGSRQLAVGDTVTIRVLNANRADRPERSQSRLSVDGDASEPVFRFGDRLANDPLNFFGNDTLRHMLFWVTVTILGFIAWFVGSHL